MGGTLQYDRFLEKKGDFPLNRDYGRKGKKNNNGSLRQFGS